MANEYRKRIKEKMGKSGTKVLVPERYGGPVDEEAQEYIQEFIGQVCEKEKIKPPSLVVIPDKFWDEITKRPHVTDLYFPLAETIAINSVRTAVPPLESLLHELGHHISYVEDRRGWVRMSDEKREEVADEIMGELEEKYREKWEKEVFGPLWEIRKRRKEK